MGKNKFINNNVGGVIVVSKDAKIAMDPKTNTQISHVLNFRKVPKELIDKNRVTGYTLLLP
ncbi:hypothetical protein [Solitalea lacus]|uniref:hypothetical protein n=1 Tax=Solitalea lacus TaxID=2911172 RepID=UPI001EDACCDF|nr:hypothetical protein [Solitalea lacus]UKJ06275.1 hypothetical protein L2B55_12085 [Solitalea lacus]